MKKKYAGIFLASILLIGTKSTVFYSNMKKIIPVDVETSIVSKKMYYEKAEAKSMVLDSRHTLSLEGNIGVNFYMEFSDEVLSNENARVEFTIDGNTVSKNVKDARTLKNYRIFTIDVTSVQMTSDINVNVLVDEESVYTETYNVKAYCDNVLARDNADQKLKDLVAALLNFGGYSQTQFNANTNNLANKDLASTDVSDVTVEMFKPYESVITGSEEGLKLEGTTLSLDSLTTIRHYFSVSNGHSISEYKFMMNNTELTPSKKGNLYYIEIPNISSTDLDKMYTVEVGKMSIKYSALSYGYKVLNKTTTSENLQNLVKALYKYNKAADTYFNKTEEPQYDNFDEVLNEFLYSYPKDATIDISKYNLTYQEVLDKIKAYTRYDKTLNIFNISINGGYSTTNDYSEKAETLRMSLFKGENYEKRYNLINDSNKKINEIIAQIPESWSDFEKALYVHDWICLNTYYDQSSKTAPNAHNIAGVLLDGRAVCQGMTDTFTTIMFRLGVPTDQAFGHGHVWNEVSLDGEWYHMDLTADNEQALGKVQHYITFVSQNRYFKVSGHVKDDGYKLDYGRTLDEDLATNTRYEEFDDKMGLYQKNMWTNEISAFQYYNGYWYNGGEKYGVYDPRVDKYVISNEVWVYKFNKDTKAFESIGVGLPAGEWKDTYRGLYIVGNQAITRTENEFIKIDLETGKATSILKVDGTIKNYYTDYTGVIKYKLTDDTTVYTHNI